MKNADGYTNLTDDDSSSQMTSRSAFDGYSAHPQKSKTANFLGRFKASDCLSTLFSKLHCCQNNSGGLLDMELDQNVDQYKNPTATK